MSRTTDRQRGHLDMACTVVHSRPASYRVIPAVNGFMTWLVTFKEAAGG